MLITYHSNQLERLVDQLTTLVSEPLASPLEPEIIVVQSNGMVRWLSLHLASALGICANVHFPFPAAFIWEMLRRILGDIPLHSPFEPAVLSWRLLALLSNLEGDAPRFEPLHAYLRDSDECRRFELACHLAEVFDQYLVYRPDWILAWETGKEEHWQAELWRRLASGGGSHRVRLYQQLIEALAAGCAREVELPQRVSVIGISAMPPTYLDIFARLSQLMDVHLFLLNPCREYWGDIVAERDIARRGADVDAGALYLEVGNSLLASLGKQGRDFIDLLQNYPGAVVEKFSEPSGDSLLHCLQRDILNLHDRGADLPVIPICLDDRSVQVHACHSPMREVEVLHDQLLDLFQGRPQLQPADVIVMTPDIEAYSPYIEAVFGATEGEAHIPFSIADRQLPVQSSLLATFFDLLDLCGSRFPVDRVLALLENGAIQRRFGFTEKDLALLQRWVRETGIRWGIDPDKRAEIGLPATRENTWRAGLDRLLLGYALPGEGRHMLADILPYDEVEGESTQLIGGLQTFAEAVFSLETELAGQRMLSAWGETLNGLLQRFLLPDEVQEREAQLLRTALEKMVHSAELAGFMRPLPLEVIKSYLRRRFEAAEGSVGRFFSGGVTFCAMVPMRSIPFKVICLIGMSYENYPRPQRTLGFDFMARRFRRGDRSRRNDDRYLFLEALLSARDCFYLSYLGNDIRDNSVKPPSVLVSELLDAIDRGFRDARGGNGVRDQILTRHPLQPFSRRYFEGGGKLFSYSAAMAEASRLAGQGERELTPFIGSQLPEPDEEWRRVEVAELASFFAHPSRYLLRRRLKIQLEEGEGLLEAREPFTLDHLAGYELRERMLSLYQSGTPLTATLEVVKGDGKLPHGQIGECVFQRQREEVERFAARLTKALPVDKLQPLAVDLPLGDFHLSGWLTGISPQGIVGYRLAKVRARDMLELWIRHLLLNLLAPEGVRPFSCWLGRDREVLLRPLANPRPHLEDLLAGYWRGLHQPLPFFPKSAFTYVQALRDGQLSAEARARREWEGDDFYAGESQDPYYQLAFRGGDPLQEEFRSLAVRIFQPLFTCMEGGSDGAYPATGRA